MTQLGSGGSPSHRRRPKDADPLRKPETLELVRAYFTIEDATVRRRLLDLAKALATASDAPDTTLQPRQLVA